MRSYSALIYYYGYEPAGAIKVSHDLGMMIKYQSKKRNII